MSADWKKLALAAVVVAIPGALLLPALQPAREASAFPATRISLGAPRNITAPDGSATAGSAWIEFPVFLTNSGAKAVWAYGYSEGFPFYRISTRQAGLAEWHELEGGFCGTGAGPYAIDPGCTQTFKIAVPIKYAGQQIKVTTSVSTSDSWSSPFEISSDPAAIH